MYLLYIKVNWSEFKRLSAKHDGDQFMEKLCDEIKSYYDVDGWWNSFTSSWNRLKVTPTRNHFWLFGENAVFGGFLSRII